jgi:hypothetical protein
MGGRPVRRHRLPLLPLQRLPVVVLELAPRATPIAPARSQVPLRPARHAQAAPPMLPIGEEGFGRDPTGSDSSLSDRAVQRSTGLLFGGKRTAGVPGPRMPKNGMIRRGGNPSGGPHRIKPPLPMVVGLPAHLHQGRAMPRRHRVRLKQSPGTSSVTRDRSLCQRAGLGFCGPGRFWATPLPIRACLDCRRRRHWVRVHSNRLGYVVDDP